MPQKRKETKSNQTKVDALKRRVCSFVQILLSLVFWEIEQNVEKESQFWISIVDTPDESGGE